MNKSARLTLLVAAVLVAVVGFLILRPGENSEPTSDSAQSRPTSPAPKLQPSPEKQRGDRTRPARRPADQVRVKGGQPVGGPTEIEASKGDRVSFTVSADVADEVHLHGYDISRPVQTGRQARFTFTADIEGIFEIELEQRATKIATLTVEP